MIQEYLGFEPVIFEDSEILILGSFPSIKSRELNFYYGNPRNRFWKTIANIYSKQLPKTIQEKIELCKYCKIALWDIVTKSDLSGSSDIELEKSNNTFADITNLLKQYPSIRKIICNGKLSYNLFNKFYIVNIPVVYLPSTSPANPTFNENLWEKELKTKLI